MDIVLIAGLWLDGSAWAEVADELAVRGHRPVPLTLPGQGDGNRSATLTDQIDVVLAAVNAADGPALVVGHSAASTLAWIAADRRPERVAAAVLIGGFPTADGGRYFTGLDPVDGQLPFPGWEPFEGPDSADLDDAARQRIAAAAIPVPEEVVTGMVRLTDERRHRVPVVVVCPEFDTDDARAWVQAGDVPELAAATDVTYVDVDSGHWPMFTRPRELAELIVAAIP